MKIEKSHAAFRKLLGAVGAAVLLTGIATTQASAGLLIGVILPGQNQARVAFELKAMQDAAAANGDELIVQYSMESAATQKNQVEAMIERGVNVIIMTPIDAVAAGALVKQAQAAGIKVITYDRNIAGNSAVPDFAVTRNNYDAGVLHAKEALKVKPTGKYAIIRGDGSTLAQIDMGRAYDELLKGKPGINIVYDTLTPGWDTATAQREAEAALQKTPDLDAIVVMWDNGAQASAQALKQAGVEPGKVYISGTDASAASLALIHQGWQTQTVWTPIDQMGRDAANIAHALGTGKKPDVKTTAVNGINTDFVDTVSVTKDNLCEYITKISPPGWINPDAVFGAGNNPCK